MSGDLVGLVNRRIIRELPLGNESVMRMARHVYRRRMEALRL